MSTMRWELPAATLPLPVVPAQPEAPEIPAEAHPAPRPADLPDVARRRPSAVLASTLPALLLLGLCVAGLSDPPDRSSTGSRSVSRLHVPRQDPSYLPSVPLHH